MEYNIFMDENLNLNGNSEIDQALKQFEAESKQEQPVSNVITPQSPKPLNHEVEGVSFDTDKEVPSYGAIKYYKETVEPKMVKAVIKLSGGTVKNQRQAEWILFGFVVLAVGISIYLTFFSGHKPPTITPAMLEQMKHPNIN